MVTTKETLHLLCKSIVNRLENDRSVSFPARLRKIIQDEIHGLIAPFVFTQEDLRERVLLKIGARAELLEDLNFTASEQYRTAKSIVQSSFGSDEWNGFYFQKTPKFVVHEIVEYLMRSSHIDDVYEVDEVLEAQILEIIKKFDPSSQH